MTISLNSLFGTISGKGSGSVAFAERLKWVGLGLILLLALLVIDYFVNQSDEQFTQSDLLPELPMEPQTKQSSGEETEVIGLYSQFDQPKAVEAEKEDESTTDIIDKMSLAEQNRQSGLLSKLYIGNAIYRLSGVVQVGEYKAALSVSYTQQPKEHAVSESDATLDRLREEMQPQVGKTNISLFQGDLLGPYTVESVDSRRMVLVDNGRRLWLELFVPLRIKQGSVIDSNRVENR